MWALLGAVGCAGLSGSGTDSSGATGALQNDVDPSHDAYGGAGWIYVQILSGPSADAATMPAANVAISVDGATNSVELSTDDNGRAEVRVPLGAYSIYIKGSPEPTVYQLDNGQASATPSLTYDVIVPARGEYDFGSVELTLWEADAAMYPPVDPITPSACEEGVEKCDDSRTSVLLCVGGAFQVETDCSADPHPDSTCDLHDDGSPYCN